MNRLKRILLIVNLQTVVITLLSVLSTALCLRYGLTADLPFTLVATAVVFPIVFSIGGAYKRRETVLDRYADLKAHGRAIYLASRDWLETPDAVVLERARTVLGDLLGACRALFTGRVADMQHNEMRVYAAFAGLSRFVRDELRGRGLASGEVSRCNQYVSKMLLSFETTKHIYQYRTPRTLKAFSTLFIVLLPILYGPYFAYVALEGAAAITYLTPVLFSLVLVSLENIQEHLEDPFDQIGEDDVIINVEKFLARLDPQPVAVAPLAA